MTSTVELGAPLRRQVLATNRQQVQLIVAAARARAVTMRNRFVFFAAFDGTHNDLANEGNAQNTNVAQLFLQVKAAAQPLPNMRAKYYAGPGTKGTITHSAWLSAAVTQQVINTAESAYADFASEASSWIHDHPRAQVTVAMTAFSRGVASAAIFSQLLYARGLIDPNPPRGVLVPPAQLKVATGVLFDPVATGVTGNLAFAPNVDNIVDIRAQDEYRQLFRAVDYSSQSPAVTTVAMLGNHSDIGGDYDQGIGALTLDAATQFFTKSGLPIAEVDTSRQFAGVDAIAIHSEEFDDAGHPQWDEYLPGFVSAVIKVPSPRLDDHDVSVTPLTT